MALKTWNEMRKVDITNYVKQRDKANYLPWAECLKLLYENGAEKVSIRTLTDVNGSSLFMSDQVYTDKNKVTNRCYEVRVKIVIDDLVFEAQYPLMNGSNPVKDNSMSQQRVWNAQTRAFVKGVAMRTGLGFNLWLKEDMDTNTDEDLSKHNIFAIRERMQQQCTALVKKGIPTAEIAQKVGVPEQSLLGYYLGSVFDEIWRIETEMSKL
jgi:hypothetical protein